jgi:hypothetical protein
MAHLLGAPDPTASRAYLQLSVEEQGLLLPGMAGVLSLWIGLLILGDIAGVL